MLMINIQRSQMTKTSTERKEETNINSEQSNMGAENIRTIREMIWGEESICKSTNSYSSTPDIQDGRFVIS